MTALQEEDEGLQPRLNNPATQDTTEMQPFERIKAPSQSMDGPVTYARAQRGEIPMRGGGQPQNMPQKQDKSSDILAQDGLKLRLELNLDIEVELKANIHGDLTLAIMS
jgi:small subunit ribosomal protein S8e